MGLRASWYVDVCAGAHDHSRLAKASSGVFYSQCKVANVPPQPWLPTQVKRWESLRWAVVLERDALCLCLCRVFSRLGGPQFSKYTIWVMVGIQGGVVAIDFSAFPVHCSKLRTDGRSVSFSSFYLLERIKDHIQWIRLLACCVFLSSLPQLVVYIFFLLFFFTSFATFYFSKSNMQSFLRQR